jgi:hypothetical protein
MFLPSRGGPIRETITMKTKLSLLYLISVPLLLQAQGTFQNLDFESANLAPVPSGQFGGLVPISDALPSWTAYLGTGQTSQILQNNLAGGSPSISILGPNWGNSFGIAIIEGNYSAVLQAGSLGPVLAVIAQTGLVPANSQSLQLRGPPSSTTGQFVVTLGGLPITMTPLFDTATYTLFGGDISSFAGQTSELRIAALPTSLYFSVDSIQFSTSPIPEPSSVWLLLVGSGVLFYVRSKQPARRLNPET